MKKTKLKLYLPWVLLGLLCLGVVFFYVGRFFEWPHEKKVQPLFYQRVGAYTSHKPFKSSQPKTYYTLEFGVFSSEKEAQALVNDLDKKGVVAFYTPFQGEKGEIFYQVRQGLFQEESQAKRRASKLQVGSAPLVKPLIL